MDKPHVAVVASLAAFAALLVTSLAAPRLARADDEEPHVLASPTFSIEADVRYAWVPRPPSLTLYEPGQHRSRIDGVSSGFVGGDTAMQGVGAHFGLVYHPTPNLMVPTLGVTFGGATGGYGTTTRDDGLSFAPDPLYYFVTLDVIGLGLQTQRGPFTASASARAGVDYFSVTGRLADAQIAEDANGRGWALAVRAEARLCVRASDSGAARVCVFGGPNVVEGTHLLNGGYAGLGATF